MRDYQLVTDLGELDALIAELRGAPLVAFDVETGYTSPKAVEKRALDLYHPDFIVVGFSVSADPSWARYVPLRHDFEQFFEHPKAVWERMRPILEEQPLLAHHKKFEDRVLRGLVRQGDADAPIKTMRGHDSMLAAYVSGQFKTSALKELTQEILGEDQATFGSLFEGKDGKPATAAQVKRSRFNQLRPTSPAVLSYACDDTALAYAIYKHLLALLGPAQMQVYNLELAISAMMTEAEDYGVGVTWADMQEARKAGETFRPNFEHRVREDIASMTPDPKVQEQARTANLASAVQMRKLLYEGLNLTTTRTTGSGALSTDAQALEGLSRRHSGVRGLLDLREVDNLLRRIKKWELEYSEAYDARIHPSFAQTQVVTGRFSANDPAAQQLPKNWLWSIHRDENGKPLAEGDNGDDHWMGNFREFIAANENRYLLLFDYSQIELRVLAGVTQEPTLLRAFELGEDPHTATASMMLGIPLDQVSSEERAIGKTLNFAILYGQGPKSMAERLAISLPEAQALEADYKAQFTKIDAWTSAQKVRALRDKYVTTWLGRKVPLWNAYSDKTHLLAHAERLSVNAPIQGGASDYVKIAMLRSQAALVQHGLWGNGVMLTMNQHDSLVFEVDNSINPNDLRRVLHEAVVFDPKPLFPHMTVPDFPTFEVDWELGVTWGGAAKWAGETTALWSEEHKQWHLSTVEPHEVASTKALVKTPTKISLPEISLPESSEKSLILRIDLPAVVGLSDQDLVNVQASLDALCVNYPGDLDTAVVYRDEVVAQAKTGLDTGHAGLLGLVFEGCTVSLDEEDGT